MVGDGRFKETEDGRKTETEAEGETESATYVKLHG